MQTALIVFSICTATLTGGTLGFWGAMHQEQQRISRSFRAQAGADDARSSLQGNLLSTGIPRKVILLLISQTHFEADHGHRLPKIWLLQERSLKTLLTKAGLAGRATLSGCARTRAKLSIAGAIIGFAVGLIFSEMLALMLLAVGFVSGYHLVRTSLKSEVDLRTSAVEQELSQLIEVLVLGLRSGLSFDRSLEFYCHYFKCSLSHTFYRLKTQWDHGLITRDEGLHAVAESYDSPLLERVMESIIRSLRFGTSMAETLSNSAAEIRATRKAKLEERVAKAPVKMLIPIGTLILPAMLILILGPIILELITGF